MYGPWHCVLFYILSSLHHSLLWQYCVSGAIRLRNIKAGFDKKIVSRRPDCERWIRFTSLSLYRHFRSARPLTTSYFALLPFVFGTGISRVMSFPIPPWLFTFRLSLRMVFCKCWLIRKFFRKITRLYSVTGHIVHSAYCVVSPVHQTHRSLKHLSLSFRNCSYWPLLRNRKIKPKFDPSAEGVKTC